jgi:ABC-type tungstate transport system permease subunit
LALIPLRRVLLAFITCAAVLPVAAQDKFIVMASTTSTEQSGLFGHLLPRFKAATGIDVRVVAAATPMSCSCTTRRRKRSSSPKVLPPCAGT